MQHFSYVILGGGMVAGYAAKEFAERSGQPGTLLIVGAEPTLPYERPPLSKDFLAGKTRDANEIVINEAAFYRDHGIDMRLDTIVADVDLVNQRLRTASGDEIGFDKLLIATGSKVRTLDLPGSDLSGIHYLRTVNDSASIRKAAAQARQVVVIGGGYIGLETSAVLAQHGLNPTVILPDDRLMRRLFTPEMGAFFGRFYTERGVTLKTNAKATAFNGDDHVRAVVLDSGEELAADLVVAGIGVAPLTDLFTSSGLLITNGIVVNEYLETNLPNVYAAGDVTNYRDVIFGKQRHVEHWNNAVEQGKHAMRVMLGEREPFRVLPYFFSDEFDLSWEFWGDTDEYDQVVYRGDVNSPSFSAWWLKADRLMAAFVMARPDDERDAAQAWIADRRTVDADRLRDESKPLQGN